MTLPRSLKWIAGSFLSLIVLTAGFLAFFDWNWLRGPIERMTLEKTGRQLVIGGDIEVTFGWPLPRIQTGAVTFANPGWASEKQMVAAEAMDITIDLAQLLRKNIVFPEVSFVRPVIFLERSPDGRRNWLLDMQQQDESARIQIGRLALDQGSLGYDDAGQKTSIRAKLSTSVTPPAGQVLEFTAQGTFKGMPVKANGSGGPVLGLRDENTPYPLTADLAVGRTAAKVSGTITSLLKFSAMDMRLDLRGDSLAQLFPLLGITFPETRPYVTAGRIAHSGQAWHYRKFSGRIGESDIAGTLQVDTGSKPPTLKADLVSKVLDIADLGPLIGVRPGRIPPGRQGAAPSSQTDSASPAQVRLLPDMPFRTDRWGSVDAQVSLKAGTIRRAGALPLEDLATHLSLRDSVLTLDPLDFGVAGGHLKGVISLDGRKDPIHAKAQLRAKKILIAKLFPAVESNAAATGEINGEFNLSGNGTSVRSMLAGSNGKIGLVVVRGEISKMTMEKAGVHLWEMMELKMTGDKLVKIRCVVADFDVKEGVMHTNALVFDTEVTTIHGTGSIDLGKEKLDLTLTQKTKNTSPLALRSPIRVRGSFARPDAGVDKGQITARALGAILLGAVNPLLALIPLIDAGPGSDSECRQLIHDAGVGAR